MADLKLYNYMEKLVYEKVVEFLKNNTSICSCDKCKIDICALALNNLPSKYVVTSKGKVYSKLEKLSSQYSADLIREIIIASKKVSLNKSHWNAAINNYFHN